MRPKGRIDVGGATAASGKMATWRAVLVAAARAPLRGRLAGLRLPRSQRRLPSWRVAAAAVAWGGSLAMCYSGRTGVFPVVLAQNILRCMEQTRVRCMEPGSDPLHSLGFLS